ncbi:MAG: FtsX-like permease family protein, partial [Acidobacteriaceae bacterium]|nr:FtsX-like permease family protein [Acidobacteriaceae bacterium]
MQTMLADSVATPRFRTFLVTVFAAIALLLAMAGVYGVVSYQVTQRTAEMGLRMAMGSAPRQIVNLVLRNAAALAAAGLLLGLLLSLAAVSLVQGLLFGVQPADIYAYSIAATAVAVITLIAAAVPAWRASRIDPAIALRDE